MKRALTLLFAAVVAMLALPSGPAHAQLPEQSVVIRSGTNPNMCLDVAQFSLSDGAVILHFECNGAPNQRFTPKFKGLITDRHQNFFEIYEIVSDWSGKCVDVLDERTNSGAQVIQKTCNGHQSQQWLALRASHNVQTDLVNRHTIDGLFNNPRCLDVPGATTGRAVMQIWDCNGTVAQRFTFVP